MDSNQDPSEPLKDHRAQDSVGLPQDESEYFFFSSVHSQYLNNV